jgi:hypothetical protein
MNAGFTTTGLLWPDQAITVSIVPDGTVMIGGNKSTLQADWTALFGEEWKNQFQRVLRAWQGSAGKLAFTMVNDNGAPYGSPRGPYPTFQHSQFFGDIRLGGYKSTSYYLGLTYPPYLWSSIGGSMNINTERVNHIGSNYDLFSLMLHEFGHALGLGESYNQPAVMYPTLSRVYTGLFADDLAGIRTIYGQPGAALAREVQPWQLMESQCHPFVTVGA